MKHHASPDTTSRLGAVVEVGVAVNVAVALRASRFGRGGFGGGHVLRDDDGVHVGDRLAALDHGGGEGGRGGDGGGGVVKGAGHAAECLGDGAHGALGAVPRRAGDRGGLSGLSGGRAAARAAAAGKTAQGDGDGGGLRAGLLSVGVVGGVHVRGLARGAVASGGDDPVTVEGVAVHLAEVVPDGAVVLEGVLVLHDAARTGRGELDGPAVAIGELGPFLGVGAAGGEGLGDGAGAAAGGGDVVEGDVVVAVVQDDGTANALCKRGGGQEGRGGDEGVHRSGCEICGDARRVV